MALQFILGSAGSGKSRILYEKMIQKSKEMKDKNIVAIVPEQFSMEAQKEILTLHDKHGSFNIEVTSFNRLAYSIFEEQGIAGFDIMDDLGKTLIMRKVLEDCKEELILYKEKASKPGFADKMNTLIAELKQYGIDESKLNGIQNNVSDNKILGDKFHDVQIIAKAFNEYVDEKTFPTEEVLNIVSEHIPNSEYVKNTFFYIDGYTGFTPVQYKVIEQLIKHSMNVCMAVTLPEEEMGFKDYNPFELFKLSKETIIKTRELAQHNGVEVLPDLVAGKGSAPYRIRANEQLCFIEKNIFRTNNKYSKDVDAVEIYTSQNPQEEAKFVVHKISQLIAHGYRYNDIAVITGDMEGYYKVLEEEFYKNNIPAFIDHKRDISANPYIDGLKAVIEVVESNFSYDSVFHLLKTGILQMDKNTMDLLENYVLKSGRKFYKSYAARWEKDYKKYTEEQLETINSGREFLVEKLDKVRGGLNKKASVTEYCKAIYEFMLDIDMFGQIETQIKYFKENNMLSLQKEYQQIYENITGLLQKYSDVMGNEYLSLSEFKQILQAGFESIKIGIIPPGLDTVMVGDIERSRLKDTKKIIFFMGVNDGIIPKASSGGGIITDKEREVLENKNYTLAPTAKENVFKQKFYLYSLLAKPTEKIILTFSKSDSDGSIRRKSYLIGTMSDMFENIEIVDTDSISIDENKIINKIIAKEYIASKMQDFRHGDEDELFARISATLMNDNETRDTVKLMVQGAFYSNETKPLSQQIAKTLYGPKDNIMTTRLEKFASCAYSQFLRYGLKLGEREKFELASFDIGNLYHDAINKFFEIVKQRQIAWTTIDEETAHEIIEMCVEQVMGEYDNEALDADSRSLFIKSKVRQTTIETVDMLIKQIKKGKFQPKAYEVRVAHGRADRVDVYETEDEVYVKVIDYKSGNKKFRLIDTFLGIQLQLMLYLKDSIDKYQKEYPDKKVRPGAGLYFHVSNPVVDRPNISKLEKSFSEANPGVEPDREELLYDAIKLEKEKKYKMNGLVNANPDVYQSIDNDLVNLGVTSNIVPVGVTKAGAISKRGSSVMENKHYEKLLQYVGDKVASMQDEIVEGKIDINPIEKACKYCPYLGICNFDSKLGDEYEDDKDISLEEAISILDGEKTLEEIRKED